MRVRLGLALSSLILFNNLAAATVTQVDGTIVPVLNPPSAGCDGVLDDNLQICFNNQEGVAPPAATAIDAILDAAQTPEVFLPNTTMPVTFRDISEGAGFENSFGYYNVGDDITNTANLHPILGCGVSAATHAGEAGGYVVNAEPGAVASVNFASEQTAGRYKGGFIAFYLISPEGNASANNCGDFQNGSDGLSLFGHIYFTQRDLNDDGDFVHHLVYSSKVTVNRFYFGFEDLFRGGDNDFEDMLIQVTGLTPPCAPQAEVCNGLDDDCDGLIDAADPTLSGAGAPCVCDGSGLICQGGPAEGICQDGTTVCTAGALECQPGAPEAETCDLEDDNCNGIVDDNPAGAGAACDGTDADLCPDGATSCVMGALLCTDDAASQMEICNGADDDCDGSTDEGNPGGGAACDGADGDLCLEGTTACSGGVLLCSDGTSTTGELCNGVDDDCDGVIDDSPSDVGGPCSVGVGVCQRSGAFVCTAGVPTCNVGPGTPSSELCNGLDDDCDGQTDEGYNLGAACDGIGACGLGVIECASLTESRCSTDMGGSGYGGTPEQCNGIDDDCDGQIDEGLNDLGPCGIATGECEEGRQRCIAGAPVCVGSIGPTPEVCDGRDNDCDGAIDDSPIDAGATCGSGTGACEFGLTVCTAGALDCVGGTGPTPELCNGADDDCNGIVDNDPTDDDTPCGASDVGECDFGRTICTAGALSCAGEIGPTQETCNGLDDDCDGTVDDMALGVGAPCGTAGFCTPGRFECTAGVLVCVGGGGGTPEVCNGIDDDCDGVIDDDPAGLGEICGVNVPPCEPGRTFCIAGMIQCVGGVTPTTEICNSIDDDCDMNVDEGDICAGGLCIDGVCAPPCIPGEFPCAPGLRCEDGFCVADPCYLVECTPLASGEATTCRNGVCVPVCELANCTAPNVCRPSDGQCLPDDCRYFPDKCTGSEVCVGEQCVEDLCRDVACPAADQFCRDGACVQSCADVICPDLTECRSGECVPTGCDQPCAPPLICHPASGTCVVDPCIAQSCELAFACDPRSGDCVTDPCPGITCPEGQVCKLGDCFHPPSGNDAGVEYIYATGGGGSGCEVGGGRVGGGATILLLAALVLLARRRAWPLALLFALSLGGCDVDPYVLMHGGSGADGGADANPGGDAQSGADGGAGDAGDCVAEICNDVDDDCDGVADEDFDKTGDELNCGACGVSCQLTGARTECMDSACVFRECFPGNVDVNGDTSGPFADSDGCEYACFVSNGGVEACDDLDNDCDEEIDEDFLFDVDPMNCGECNRVCVLYQVAAPDCVAGDCVFDPATDCNPGFVDVDGVQSDGCEYACTVSNGGVEACDFVDNDCDGMIDEGVGAGTTPENCGVCGRVCSFPNAVPHCVMGACQFDPAIDCLPGFHDVNGNQLDGCEYACTVSNGGVEICDGLDNDCDAVVDGMTTDAGASCNAAPGGVATGPCTQTGTIRCVGGALECVGAPGPSSEICNRIDDDCDGTADDSPVDVGAVCLAPVGACSAGIYTCSGGMRTCVQAVPPSPEMCNGLDDDCDGSTDEMPNDPSLGMACGTDVGPCTTGSNQCVNGSILCQGGTGPLSETCNGADDDCDGVADDNPIDAGGSCGSDVGACVAGTHVCVGGMLTCSGGIGMSAESCNGNDDDCDGSTDEMLSMSCYTGPAGTLGMGICVGGTSTCVGGSFGACAGQVLPQPEDCDDVDEDCDGTPDDGVTQGCYGGPPGTQDVGVCRGGTQTCTAGVFGGPCAGEVQPGAESCNTLDDDCDGSADEAAGGGPLTQSCYSGPGGTQGVGTCVAGVRTCAFGAFGTCVGEVVPAADRCGDGLDSDCDAMGDTAEGCLGVVGAEVRLDAPGGGQGSTAGQFHSFDPSIASAGATVGQNVYAVWTDRRNGEADILFRRSTDGGQTWGTIQNLSSGTSLATVKAMVVAARDPALGQDRVYVVYQRVVDAPMMASDGTRQIFFRRSTDSGANFMAETRLDTSGTSDVFHHDVALSANGQRLIVVWERLNTGNLARDVICRMSTDSGATFAAERQVNLNSGAMLHVAGRPQVAVTSTGRFVVLWRERRAPADTFDVFGTFNDGSGAFSAGNERRLDGDGGDTRESDLPKLVTAGQNVFVTWQDASTLPGGGADTVFVRSTNNGAAWSGELILDDPAGEQSSSTAPAIAVDPNTASASDDRIAIAWLDTREGSQVYVATSNDAGATFGAALRASHQGGAPISGFTATPRIVSAGPSAWVVAYRNDAGGAEHIYAGSSIDGGVTWQVSDTLLDGGAGPTIDPAIVRVGAPLTLGAGVAWIDFRSGTGVNGDPYLRRFGR